MASGIKQASLFEEAVSIAPAIVGLSYIPDYIDVSRAEELLQIIDNQLWMHDLKRRVQHYGYRYDYKARTVTPESYLGPLPEWLLLHCDRLCADGLFPQTPDQVIINEYEPGQGISSHIDCVPCFTDTIVSLSLGATCVMDFMHSNTAEKQSHLLEPRSLLVLTDDARYIWQHGIAQRRTDKWNGSVLQRRRRVSMTFRKVILEDTANL